MRRKIYTIIALMLLLLNGTGALYGGGCFIIDPTGKSIGIPIGWLHYTPFRDFLIPGIILFLVNGVFSFIVILLMLRGAKNYEWYLLAAGCLLTAWIIMELKLTRMYHPLQVVLGSIGLLLTVIGLLLAKIEQKQPAV